MAVGGAPDEELLAEEEEIGSNERKGVEEAEANNDKAAAKEKKRIAVPKPGCDSGPRMRKAVDVMMRELIVQIQGVEENFRSRRKSIEKEVYVLRNEKVIKQHEKDKVERAFQYVVKQCAHLDIAEKELLAKDLLERENHDKMLCLLKKQYLFYAREAFSAFGRPKSNAAYELELSCCSCHKKPLLTVDGLLVNEECVLECGHFFCLSCLPPTDDPCSACPPIVRAFEPEAVPLASLPPGIPPMHSFMPPFFPGQNAHQIYFPLHFFGHNQIPIVQQQQQPPQQTELAQEFPHDDQQE
jgi:hypothetical protein